MTEENKMKIVFDPAFFESFEGTQEELDSLMSEITGIFEGKTGEEIKAMSQPVDWDELDEEEAKQLAKSLENTRNGTGPTLQ
jgi:hypothetical protein